MRRTKFQDVPSFFLYGEPPCAIDDGFLHLEDLDERSRPSHWNIRPHVHAALHHIFFIENGGGSMTADDGCLEFRAPALLLVPARVVHAFRYEIDTAGQVLTLAQGCLDRLLTNAAELRGLFAAPARLELAGERIFLPSILESLTRLGREIAWDAPGRQIAIDSCLLTILVDLLRLRGLVPAPTQHSAGPAASLVARYRAQIEARFRDDHRIADYAATLGISVARLRAACQSVTGQPPSDLLRQRQLLEARRLLLFSNISVNEAAYRLGFEDPAYFSRVFTRGVGCSPRAFRRKEAVITEQK